MTTSPPCREFRLHLSPLRTTLSKLHFPILLVQLLQVCGRHGYKLMEEFKMKVGYNIIFDFLEAELANSIHPNLRISPMHWPRATAARGAGLCSAVATVESSTVRRPARWGKDVLEVRASLRSEQPFVCGDELRYLFCLLFFSDRHKVGGTTWPSAMRPVQAPLAAACLA